MESERRSTEDVLAIRASQVAGELARVRQRGLGNLDKKSHNQEPVKAEKLTRLADKHNEIRELRLHGRDALVRRLLQDSIAAYKDRGNEPEADFLSILFFDPKSRRRSPRDLLKLAQKEYGPDDQQRFADKRRDIFERFSTFLIAYVQESVDELSNSQPPSSPASLVLSPEFWPTGSTRDLTGMWHSHYVYRSSSREDKEFESEHYLVLKQDADMVVAESLPNTERSHVRLLLQIDGSIASGTWTERTSPVKYYRGATYHGVIQMVIDPRGRRLKGKWLGFDTEFNIQVGDWTLTWLEGAIDDDTLKQYANKV